MKTHSERIAAAKRAIRSNSQDGIERRSVPFIDVRAQDSTDGGYRIVGHGAVFNSLSDNLGQFGDWYERIEPGAFTNVLKRNPDVRALFNHDPNQVLARTRNGSLSLAEDAKGLAYDASVSAELAATDIGKRMRVYLGEGLVDQSSFAFRVARKGDSWDEDEQGRLVRTIHKFSELYDVSPVAYPAYPAADSGLASAPVVEAASRTSAPALAARASRLEEREEAMRDEAAPERKARKRKLMREGWNDNLGVGLTPARTARSIDLALKAEPEVTNVDAIYEGIVRDRIRLHEWYGQ